MEDSQAAYILLPHYTSASGYLLQLSIQDAPVPNVHLGELVDSRYQALTSILSSAEQRSLKTLLRASVPSTL